MYQTTDQPTRCDLQSSRSAEQTYMYYTASWYQGHWYENMHNITTCEIDSDTAGWLSIWSNVAVFARSNNAKMFIPK